MSSRLVYFGNVITRTDALVKANVIKEPKWLQACKKFPPLSEPVNPELPTWENIPQTRTHRVLNFVRLDGHRFDPKKPTEFPKETQTTHPDQPYHVYFTRDTQRQQFYSAHPSHPVHITYNKSNTSACDRWINSGGELNEEHAEDLAECQFENARVDLAHSREERDMWEEFQEIRNNVDISDIDLTNT